MTKNRDLCALIVESDDAIRQKLLEKLEKHSVSCIEAENGMIALERLENHHIDFVIADAHMKKMDCIQFIQVVHRNHKNMPVIVTAGEVDDELIINAFRAGAVNVVKKYNDFDEIEAILRPITALIEKRKSSKFDFSCVRYFTEELTIKTDLSLIPIAVERLMNHLIDSKYAPRLSGMEVALFEMLANGIEHGNLEITNEEKEQALGENRYNELVWERRNNPSFENRRVRIKMNYNPRQLTFTISDEGRGFDVSTFQKPTRDRLLEQCGRGILLSKMYCDEIRYNKKGNQVTLVFKADTESDKEGVVHAQMREFPDPHILIVDNNPHILRHISNLLTEVGYSYGYIAHSHHLMPRLKEDQFDLILLDVGMPKTDGLILLKQIKQHSLLRSIPVIMLTSDKDDRLMADCFNAGAEDFLVKPLNKLTLKSRIDAVLTQRESIKDLGAANEQLERLNSRLQEQYNVLIQTQQKLEQKHRQIEDDIRLAQRIQKNILSTSKDLQFFRTAVLFRPHSIVSGDFHYQELDHSGHLNLFLGDATGHGISAAFLTMMVRMALGMIDLELEPDQMMSRLNQQLAACVPRGDYMTGTMLKIHETGEIEGCSAGGPPCVIVDQNGCARLALKEGGQALGMFPEERIPFKKESFRLAPGERILLFTDGLLEWRNHANQSFSLGAVIEYLQTYQQPDLSNWLRDLADTVERNSENRAQSDDITLIGVEMKN